VEQEAPDPTVVIPAKAGISVSSSVSVVREIPAYAGMTIFLLHGRAPMLCEHLL